MYFAIRRRVDDLGRLVLPKDLRDHYGIKAGDILEIVATEDGILLKTSVENGKEEKTK